MIPTLPMLSTLGTGVSLLSETMVCGSGTQSVDPKSTWMLDQTCALTLFRQQDGPFFRKCHSDLGSGLKRIVDFFLNREDLSERPS